MTTFFIVIGVLSLGGILYRFVARVTSRQLARSTVSKDINR